MYLQKVNEKPQVINDYEAGRGIPNQVVIGKIEKAIGKWIHVQNGQRTQKNNSTVGLEGKGFCFIIFWPTGQMFEYCVLHLVTARSE